MPESTRQSGIQLWGLTPTPCSCNCAVSAWVEVRRVLTCTVISGASLSAMSIGSRVPLGRFCFKSPIRASGWLYLSAKEVGSCKLPLVRTALRSTPLTREAALGLRLYCFASATDSLTAALSGILSSS